MECQVKGANRWNIHHARFHSFFILPDEFFSEATEGPLSYDPRYSSIATTTTTSWTKSI
jgi:hypothetical protein